MAVHEVRGVATVPGTALAVGVACSPQGVTGVRLHAADDAPQVAWPEPSAQALATRVAEHCVGRRRDDFRDLVLDHDGAGVGAFDRRVLELLRAEVGPGRTTTYLDLARRLDAPGAARAVGGAMRRNPFVVVVPCHRVLNARGGLGNYSGAGGVATKRALLQAEGALSSILSYTT